MNIRRFVTPHLSGTVLLLALCITAHAQQSKPATQLSNEDERIARLAGLAKVWGAIKYFHPFLAYRNIDWDKALIETIPKVSAAKTSQEYQAAINQMLAVLSDPSTRAGIEPDNKSVPPTQTSATAENFVRTENGVLVIHATQIAETSARNPAAFTGFVSRINGAIPGAKAVVMDARGASQDDDVAFYFSRLLRQVLPQMLDEDVTLGTRRYRMYSGYPTQLTGFAGSYYAGLFNVVPTTINGQNKAKTPPIVFIVNENTTAIEFLNGLHSAKRAFVVQEGEQSPGTSSTDWTIKLPHKVHVRIRTDEYINPDGSLGFQADAVVPKGGDGNAAMLKAMQAAQQNSVGPPRSRTSSNLASQVSLKDKPCSEMEFPTSEYRLLALFRYWNIVNYFFPYKHLIDEPWESVLTRYIPKFEANKDAIDYQLTVREMVTEMQDSHGGVGNTKALTEKLGTYLPPIVVRYMENQTVVTNVLDDKLPLKVGDVILSVDGEPVEKRRESLSRLIASSTPQALMAMVHWTLLRGQKDSTMKLRVRGVDGAFREVEIVRSLQKIISDSVIDWRQFIPTRSTPIVQVLPSGYGYVDLGRLPLSDVDKMFETIKGTPAVIFDMRGYPNVTMFAIAPRLTEKKRVAGALFSRRLLEAPHLSDAGFRESSNHAFAQTLPERQGDVYKGKVVMLINEEAFSRAEHTCLLFEAATDVTFIGTPTMGCNGDVTFMVLPGNLLVSFTGHDVRHADGRQLQRVGIQPAIRVAPTIQGLAASRDEVLERAVKYLQDNVKK